ncbi:hypothetical protein [Poseidonibacter lekithochrous]|uniref:hypothetical protein n=1 Tax=Poseidonibacter lekithochrous TaxID=1904463 RepID=UPI000D3CFD30|nr:hypothetical protein [Poseidonibacter lekithochrous]
MQRGIKKNKNLRGKSDYTSIQRHHENIIHNLKDERQKFIEDVNELKTFDTKDESIEDYFPDFKELIYKNNTITNAMFFDKYIINTYRISMNPNMIVDDSFNKSKIDKLTYKLSHYFFTEDNIVKLFKNTAFEASKSYISNTSN